MVGFNCSVSVARDHVILKRERIAAIVKLVANSNVVRIE